MMMMNPPFQKKTNNYPKHLLLIQNLIVLLFHICSASLNDDENVSPKYPPPQTKRRATPFMKMAMIMIMTNPIPLEAVHNYLKSKVVYYTLEESKNQLTMWRLNILELCKNANSICCRGECFNHMVTAGVQQKRRRRIDVVAKRFQTQGRSDYKNAMSGLAEESQSIEQSHQMVGKIIASDKLV
eukprot:14073506-Ditylum_brightwellii.AAC.1